MKTKMLGVALFSLLAAALALAPTHAFAQEKKPEKAATEKKEPSKGEKKEGRIPFHGKLVAVDKTAKTITVGERTFQITSESKLSKAGKPATLDDAAVGDEVSGNYQKADDGKLHAKSVRFGPKPEGDAKKPANSKKHKSGGSARALSTPTA